MTNAEFARLTAIAYAIAANGIDDTDTEETES